MINRILRRLAVNRRITGGFLILALLLALSVPLIITNQNFILQRLQQVSNVETRADRLLLVASTRIASSRVNLIRYIQGYAASPRVALDDVDQAAQLLGQARDLITSEEQQKSVTLILDAMELYRKLIGELQEARDSGMTVTAGRLEFQTFRLGSDIGQRIELIVSNSEAGVAEANRSIFVEARGRLVFLVAGYIGVLALTVLFAVLVARSITLPVAELRRAADEFRQGNMQVAVPVTGTDELSLLAQTFNQLSAELSTLYRNLEQRVEDRTQRLETVAALSERLSAILNLESLLDEVVNQIKDNFHYYHAHIYLLDEQRNNLVVAEGTGVAGKEMKARGHSIPLNAPASLVARAARSGQIVRVDNVREAPDWLPNPLLPDTYSEMAVPIIVEGEIMGVLDVQQDRIAGLDEGDAGLLRSLANQVAVALRNARLFAEVETALADARAAQERYTIGAWRRAGQTAAEGSYHYARPNAPDLDAAAAARFKDEALALSQPAVVAANGDRRPAAPEPPENGRPLPTSIVAPITLQNTTIGALQIHPAADDQTWTEDDLAVVEAVVNQFALVAESRRLFEETRRRAGREQTIRQITDKLRAASNLKQLAEIATEELARRLSATHAGLTLGLKAGKPPGDNSPHRQHSDSPEEMAS